MSRRSCTFGRGACLGAILAGVLAIATAALADPAPEPSPEAREANAHALELDAAGKFPEALAEFQRAYDLSPSFRILYNVARTARLCQDFARSLVAYRRFLEEGGADVEGSQRAIAEQQIAELSGLVGWVIVRGYDDTSVALDGDGAAPISTEPRPVNPGAHAVHATRGPTSIDRSFTVRAGATVDVDVKIEKPKVAPVVPEPYRFPSVVTVVGWVTTGLFTGASVATGVAALALAEDLSDDVYVGPAVAPPPGSPLADKAERLDRLTTATDVLMGFAVVTGVAAITFSMIDGLSAPDKEAPPSPAIFVVPTLGGARIGGSF